MASRPKLLRTDYTAYNAWEQVGFRAAAVAGSDLATRIEDAAGYAVANGLQKLVVPAPPSGLLNISRRIVLPGALDYDFQGFVNYTGLVSVQEAAVEFGASNAQMLQKTIRIKVKRQTNSNWSSFSNIGVLLHNLYNCFVQVSSEYFTVPVECRATGPSGFAHNMLTLDRLTDGRAGLRLHTATSDGWVNQNTFIGGRWQVESDKRAAMGNPAAGVMDPTGVWFSGTGTGINNNYFINPSFEISGSTANGNTKWPQVKPWLIETNATVNTMVDARHENLYPDENITVPFLWINSENVSACKAELGYGGSPTWQEKDLVKYMTADAHRHVGNEVYLNYEKRVYSRPATSSWTSGRLSDKAKQYNAAGAIFVPGAYFNSGGTRSHWSNNNSHTIGPDYIGFSGEAISWVIDTRETKRLLIRADGVNAEGANPEYAQFRILLRPLDASDVLLSNLGANHPYIRFPGAAWTANSGGGYQTGGNSDVPVLALIHEDVKRVELCIIQIGGTAARLRSVNVSALDGGPLNVSSWYPGYADDEAWANDIPVVGWKGNWQPNTIVKNFTPSGPASAWGWRYLNPVDGFQALNP